MIIKTVKSYQQASLSEGLTVVIDVLRAFTTACYAFNNGVGTIFPVENISEALILKKNSLNNLVIGEINGLKARGANYGNSPAEIESISFTNKNIIMTTSAGTKGILGAKKANEIITGSFVNAKAVSEYILQVKPSVVTLLCTDNRWEYNEDALCATYIKNLLENKKNNFNNIKNHLINHPCTDRFLRDGSTDLLKRDFELAMDVNRFNFILKVETKNQILSLNKFVKVIKTSPSSEEWRRILD